MSRPQEPHRPLFHFGNPFRMISPKSSQLSPRLQAQLNAFEETLGDRLRKLIPQDKNEILSLTWMKSAMESLCESHTDIKTLITNLELPVTDWDEKWIDVYLDISVKLLDICIAFSSEITRLNQGHLLIQCVLHNLESDPSKKFVRARATLDSWRQHIGSKNPRLHNCGSILNSLVESLDLPKVKNSAKGKVLMRAMYGVKVQTVFICSVFAAAFSGSSKNLLHLHISDAMLWAQAYSDLQTCINGEIKDLFLHGNFTVLKELEAVDLIAKKLFPMVEDGLEANEVEAFQNSLTDLGKQAGKFSHGLDVLAKEVDVFFKIVLTGRDALLGNLRMSDTMTDPVLGINVEQQQVVR
ncbi:hypothetical protein Tsubulata_031419 [Turnera subulata]|uniref:Uncharacterized protein n=1 Tax=Turnera subulata TaxID=218843 RepID=A0A9Q0FJ38_9ROSI|nr:hypothetical protein Tsubulata_031419 [Turnera subulata]